MNFKLLKLIDGFKKLLIAWFAFWCTIWTSCSYVLAFLGKDQIAESLSENVVTTAIVTILSYCAASTIENLAKNNDWLDKTSAVSERKREKHDGSETETEQ